MTETVWLQRPSADVPWGFRLTGGRDYQEPLSVQRVTPGSVAATGLSQDDVIVRIGDTDTSSLTNSQAMEIIKSSGNMLQFLISKGGSQGWPTQQPLDQQFSNMNVGSDYGRQNSYTGPQTNAAQPSDSYMNYSNYSPTSQGHGQSHPAQPQAMPDAVLNMAHKGGPDKKPFTYAPDITSIQEQRDKVRRNLKKDQQDIKMSPVYKMIHGIDQPRNKPQPVRPMEAHGMRQPKTPSEDDELTFSGVNRQQDIPSKSFQKLQQMTGGGESEIDYSSIRHNVTGNEPIDAIGDYDQTSIRYTGRNIPSKSFRMLQHMTGADPNAVPDAAPARRPRRPPPEAQQQAQQQQHPDDVVDISYVGGTIPSRSFKVLQQSVDRQSPQQLSQQPQPQYQPVSQAPSNGDAQMPGQPRKVKVIRLRQQPQQQTQQEDTGVTDF